MDTPAPKRSRHASPPPTTAPRTITDLASEILLRLPPSDPGCLVRASAVCWPWRRLLTDAAFLRRYRSFHRTAPMLGFVINLKQHFRGMAQFVPASSFRPDALDRPGLNVLDARHGRVLLDDAEGRGGLVVWDPVTDDEWEIPPVPVFALGYNATVLCAAAAGRCDHLDCRASPFHVPFVGSGDDGITFACTYSSETGEWSKRIRIEEPAFVDSRPSVLLGDTVYFTCDPSLRFKIVGYDVAAQKLTVIWPPSQHRYQSSSALMTAEDGTLGFAGVQNGKLHLWSSKAGPHGGVKWVQHRVIEHKTMLRTRGLATPPQVVGFANGLGIIFVRTGNTVFSMELKSGHVRKVYTCRSRNYEVIIVPYMSFYTPDHATGELPSP